MARATLGVILGNRGFFPSSLVGGARKDILGLLQRMDIDAIILDEKATSHGGVETLEHARLCADLFRKNSGKLDGILVSLPNFGDERGVLDTIKLSGLNVPVLIQAYPDELGKMGGETRRDSFCGKISVCNNLNQALIPFSLTAKHVVNPNTDAFKKDLEQFLGVCRVVKGMRSVRIGAVGARPAAFNTVRYSEKILEANGVSVTTVDLSEMFGAATRMTDSDASVKAKLDEIQGYAKTGKIKADALVRMAKLGVVLERWIADNDLQATAIQCWTSIQENYGISPCALMSMMSQKLIPSGCEVDVLGVLSMYALQLAAGTPSGLVDWNNNFGDDADKCVLFHCGNWPSCYFPANEMDYQAIVGRSVGLDKTPGTLVGQAPGGAITIARLSTDDLDGSIAGYITQGQITDDKLDTFGARAVVQIPQLEVLMRMICEMGFEHHAAISQSHVADICTEAFETYLGWDIYHHGQE